MINSLPKTLSTKIKRTLLLLLILIRTIPIFGQVPEKLFFIAGFPDNDFVPEHDYLINTSAILTSIQGGLIKKTIITDSLQRLDFLRCYPEYNKIIAMTKGKNSLYEIVPSSGYQITIIDSKTLKKDVYSIPENVIIDGITISFIPVPSHLF
jgi:hypothetical protein